MVDWQSESDLDSIRNSCDVLNQEQEVLHGCLEYGMWAQKQIQYHNSLQIQDFR